MQSHPLLLQKQQINCNTKYLTLNFSKRAIWYDNAISYHFLSALTTFPAASLCTLWGGALFFRSSLDLTLTILEWIPQPIQYCILIQSLGIMQVSKALFSSRSFLEDASTMSLIVKRLMALSLGQSLPQFTQTIVFTNPLLFLLRPWFLRLTGIVVEIISIIFINLIFNINLTAIMLRAEQKYRYSREKATLNKKTQLLHFQRSGHELESTKRKKNSREDSQNNNFCNISERFNYCQKENRGINLESPRISYHFQKERQCGIDDVDSLSQIRFISKQCSSIKQNNVDIDSNSQALSRNQLEDFSPLFDRIEKNTNDDFILQIEDISQSEPSIRGKMFRKCESQREMREKKEDFQEDLVHQPKRCFKSGKIKKNIASQTANHNEGETAIMNKQIQDVFRSLDYRRQGRLTKNNCNSQNLSTQMNYLIGSILTKIKAKGRQYRLQDFKHQFNALISDSQQSQLNQIFASNKLRKRKLAQSQLKSQSSQSELFQQKQSYTNMLSKIDQKLIKYLKKNNIPQNPVPHLSHETAKSISIRSLQKNKTFKLFNNYKYDYQSQKATQQEDKSISQKCSIQNHSEQLKTQISLRSYLQKIRGLQGSQFQLSFVQLNKHI